MTVRDRLLERTVESLQTYGGADARRVAYLSAEFLPGPHLANNLLNLGITEVTRKALHELGYKLDEILAQEEEPGLGNGLVIGLLHERFIPCADRVARYAYETPQPGQRLVALGSRCHGAASTVRLIVQKKTIMHDEAIHKPSATQPDPRVKLAFKRTFLAYERTRIAWVRTALALISFGFVIAKFFQYLREKRGETATVLQPPCDWPSDDQHWTGRVDSRELAGAMGTKGLARALPRTTAINSRRPGPDWRPAAIGIESVCSQ